MDCFHQAEGCADFMCVLRGPVSDLGPVPLGYKAWCWITTLLGPARTERRGERGGMQQECVGFFVSFSCLLTTVFVGEPLLFVWDLLSFLKATHCFLHLLNPLGSAVSLYPVFFPSSSSTSHLIRWYGCMYLLNLLSVFIIRVQFLHFFICDFVLFG